MVWIGRRARLWIWENDGDKELYYVVVSHRVMYLCPSTVRVGNVVWIQHQQCITIVDPWYARWVNTMTLGIVDRRRRSMIPLFLPVGYGTGAATDWHY